MLSLLTFAVGVTSVAGVLAGAKASDDAHPKRAEQPDVHDQVLEWTASEVSTDASFRAHGNFKCPSDSGCTCIEWCNAPADVSELGIDWGVVCRVVRGCNKYSRAVKADCVADLESVQCAHNRPAVIVYEDEKI